MSKYSEKNAINSKMIRDGQLKVWVQVQDMMKQGLKPYVYAKTSRDDDDRHLTLTPIEVHNRKSFPNRDVTVYFMEEKMATKLNEMGGHIMKMMGELYLAIDAPGLLEFVQPRQHHPPVLLQKLINFSPLGIVL